MSTTSVPTLLGDVVDGVLYVGSTDDCLYAIR
jgi:hypothetical protein